MTKEKIVLAYSGGLDTSIAIKWLQEKYNYDVVAVIADLGEGKDLAAIKQKALNVGAVSCHAIDVKSVFAKEYVAPVLQANALYEGKYPLISALSRPLISKLLIDIAKQEGAVAVAHGCTGKGNDQVRFDVAFNTLAPDLKIVAPVREAPMAREDAIAYANQHNIPLPIQLNNPFSIDLNLWGRSCECGELENPWNAPPEAAYDLTTAIEDTPDAATEIVIEFANGIPIALNNNPMELSELILQLNELAGSHGVGRIDHVENRLIGIKSREIYEAPAAMTLITAHQTLESMTLSRDVAHFKPIIEQKFAETIYNGLWFSPLHKALNAFIQETQKTVHGKVRVKLHKGQAIVNGVDSSKSLYQFELATYNPEDQFDHAAAAGFIKLWGLPFQVFEKVNQS